MAREKASYWSSATAPKSDNTYSPTSSAPDTKAGRNSGAVTFQNARAGLMPRLRAPSSHAGSCASNPARNARKRYGYVDTVSASSAPGKPYTEGTGSPQRDSGSSSTPPLPNVASST